MTEGTRAAARLCVDPGGRVRWGQAWPVLLRPTGPGRVHLVHGAGGPLGGDTLSLDVDVAGGAALGVCSAAATVVQPGTGAVARWDVRARVGANGRLDWAPEATVVCDGAALESAVRVELAAGATASVREVVVLGRYGQRGGRYTGVLTVSVGGEPLLAHTTVLDGADAGLCGPAGTAGARAVGSLLVTGALDAGRRGPAGEDAGVRWAWTSLAGPGALLLAVGGPGAVQAVLDRALTTMIGVRDTSSS